MKRFDSILVVLAIFMAIPVTVSAKGGIFKAGVKGGLNFTSISHFELGYISESVSSYTGFNAGLAFSIAMPVNGMTLQPELNYVSKGAMFRGDNSSRIRMDYIEMPVNLQYGLDLILMRPFLMLSPYVGYSVLRQPADMDWTRLNRFEYGIGVGGGIDLWRFQLQVKYNWNISKLVKNVPDSLPPAADEGLVFNSDNMLKAVRNGTFRGLEVNIVFFF